MWYEHTREQKSMSDNDQPPINYFKYNCPIIGIASNTNQAWSGGMVRRGPSRESEKERRMSASRHVNTEGAARVLVHHVRYRHGWNDFDEVRSDPPVQPLQALPLHDLAKCTPHRAFRALCSFFCKLNLMYHYNN